MDALSTNKSSAFNKRPAQQSSNHQPTSNQPRQRNNNQNGRPIRLHASTGICATEARKLHANGQFAIIFYYF
jgi:hypothetical protein